jgi:hypothetical protein
MEKRLSGWCEFEAEWCTHDSGLGSGHAARLRRKERKYRWSTGFDSAHVVFLTFVFFLLVSRKRLQKRRNHPRPPAKRWALSGYSVRMM